MPAMWDLEHESVKAESPATRRTALRNLRGSRPRSGKRRAGNVLSIVRGRERSVKQMRSRACEQQHPEDDDERDGDGHVSMERWKTDSASGWSLGCLVADALRITSLDGT